MKIKKNDTVLIISGKDKGKKGKVLSAFPGQGKLMVEGVNLRKKHQRPKKSGEKGQIIIIPGLINISNVKLVCSNCNSPTRVGYKVEEKRKLRVCKKCRREI